MYLRSGLRPNPAGGAYSAPPDPVAGGCAPRAPPSLWAFGLKFASGVPQKDMGYVSITTAAKGSASLKRLKKSQTVVVEQYFIWHD